MFRTRQLLTKYITKRYYELPKSTDNINLNNINSNNRFIDYEKISNNIMQQNDLSIIERNLSEINQTIKDQKYWIFHSVALSYIGLFAYIFKM